jgi:predicted glycoside hydrolase/deacetylase ChbG (UPF0249 family)
MAVWMKELVVNADDFGLTEGINNGIVDGFNTGIITSTSLIATMPAFDHAVELAKENHDLDVGVHLCLTVGNPCSNKSKLAPILRDGEFLKHWGQVVRTIYTNQVDLRNIKDELSAQISKVQGTGLKISHIDSHQHIHMVPCLFRIVLVLMKEYFIPFVRIPNEIIQMPKWFTIKGWGLLMLGLLANLSKNKLIDSNLNSSRHFWGLSCSESMTIDDLTHILQCLGSGISELMCHPGYDDAALSRIYSGHSFRQEELSALKSRKAFDLIQQENIQLTNFRKLFDRSRQDTRACAPK